MDLSELFWNASVEEIMRGYVYQADTEEYVCLICGKRFAKGVIYPYEEHYYEAEKFTTVHIQAEHSSVFEYLLGLHKKITGLTDTQRTLLHYFYQGYSDSEIVKELDGGSTSTIRHHRFTLREKEKQAKVFLAIMGLLEGKDTKKTRFITVP
jgi:DNA-binding NarL/FixJ family response regulator